MTESYSRKTQIIGPIGTGYRKPDYEEVFLCPRCHTYNLPIGYPGAISRVDNMTEICSPCGNDEGLLDYFTKRGCQPIDEWPVTISFLMEKVVKE